MPTLATVKNSQLKQYHRISNHKKLKTQLVKPDQAIYAATGINLGTVPSKNFHPDIHENSTQLFFNGL